MDSGFEVLHFSAPGEDRVQALSKALEVMPGSVVPSFFLYGEAPQAVDDRFLHVEDLDDRSRPSDWTIRPHAHVNLSHVFLLLAGGGTMRAETRRVALHPPCLMVVPARVIHGFEFEPGTSGRVLTVSDAYLQDLLHREPELRPVLGDVACLACAEHEEIEADLQRLAKELAWRGLGHRAAIEARLLGVLVAVLRRKRAAHVEATPAASPRARLVARYRELVEARFREALSIEGAANALGVSVGRLRAACGSVARRTPLQILHDRIMLEAKRLMIYTSMPIAQVAFSLGFEDPAYFSRFFAKEDGRSPRQFKRAQLSAAAKAAPGLPLAAPPRATSRCGRRAPA